MKKIFTLTLLILCTTFLSHIFANTVIVKGFVKYNNGTPIANHPVTISNDSLFIGSTCGPMVRVRFTNTNGFYSDTLTCNGNIIKLRISTPNCNGTLLVNTPLVPASNMVENNFTLSCPPPSQMLCNAEFQWIRDSLDFKKIKFFAGINTGFPNNDPVIERKWKFGDGDSSSGNIQNPTHLYAQAGTYTACLKVKTQGGCISDFCKIVIVVNPASNNCLAAFTYIPQSSLVLFNSNISLASAGDSIISRRWTWGDNTAPLLGNTIAPQHQYGQSGIYTVCLTIKTASGCERDICKIVTATNVNSNCVPQFTAQRIAPKKVSFNSTMSWVPLNDSIIERKWKFGDNTFLNGNIANPVHEYNTLGIYTVCLKIKTALGCENEVCKPVFLQDSLFNPIINNEPIRITALYPNPVTIHMTTIVFSANNNIQSELAIYDIYGVKKWSMNKVLQQGNNVTVIPTFMLLSGPYFFKVNTVYGIKSRHFFKI